eukprot:scaffold2644_cov339-Prasinococcus_capsulatus_cf.AAC.3
MSPRCLWDRGKEVSSEGLAELIRSAGERGVNMAFLIGGPFGHSEAVHQRANASIRLSKMVLNHDVSTDPGHRIRQSSFLRQCLLTSSMFADNDLDGAGSTHRACGATLSGLDDS